MSLLTSFIMASIAFGLGANCSAQASAPKPTPNVQKLLDDAAAMTGPQLRISMYEKALELARSMKDRDGEARSLAWLGSMYNIGQGSKALEYDNRALPILREVGDRFVEATVLSNLGMVYSHFGEEQKALECYNQALPINVDIGNQFGAAVTLNNLGALYIRIGQEPKALELFNQAIPIMRALEKSVVEPTTFLVITRAEATAASNIGLIHEHLGQEQSALEFYGLALSFSREAGDRPGEAGSLDKLGWVFWRRGEGQKSFDNFNRALAIQRDVGDKFGEAASLSGIGSAYQVLDQPQKALEYFDYALSIRREESDRGGEANTLDNLATTLQSIGNCELAVVFDKQSVEVYQSLRKDIQGLNKSDQELYARSVEPTYTHLADLLISQGRLGEAEQVMDLLKAQESFEFVRRDASIAGVIGTIGKLMIEEEWWGRYEKIQDEALAIYKEEDDLTQKAQKLKLSGGTLSVGDKARLAQLKAQEGDIAEANDKYFSDMKGEAAKLGDKLKQDAIERAANMESGVAQVVKRLPPNEVAAVYAVAGKEELDYIVVSSSGYTAFPVKVTSDQLNTMVADYRKLLTDPTSDPRPMGKKLYDALFAKLLANLKSAGIKHVMWSLDGSLRYIPLAAIWDGSEYLVEREDFTMFDPLHPEVIVEADHSTETITAFAATQGKLPEYPALPGADAEVRAVVGNPSEAGFTGAVQGRAFEDSKFDRDTFQAGLLSDGVTLLHVATHFNIGKDFATSRLLLGDGNELTLQDFFGWAEGQKLAHLDLLCLSACNTAETMTDASSEGGQLSSFVSLTMGDGAKSVIASLWPVSDESTPLLMREFYRNWIAHPELGKGEALRLAQLSLLIGSGVASGGGDRAQSDATGANLPQPRNMPKFSHPYYWAPFLLFGNWK